MSRKASIIPIVRPVRVAQRRRALFDRPLGQVAGHEHGRAAGARRIARRDQRGEGGRTALPRVGIEVLEDGGERLSERLVPAPAGQRFRGVVDQQHRAVEIAGDHAVADAAQHHAEALVLGGERLLRRARLQQSRHRVTVQPLRFLDVAALVVEPADEDGVGAVDQVDRHDRQEGHPVLAPREDDRRARASAAGDDEARRRSRGNPRARFSTGTVAWRARWRRPPGRC